MKKAIIKLGGSIITKKGEDKLSIQRAILKRLSKQIAKVQEMGEGMELVVVHGAGPYGHVPAKEYSLTKGFKDKTQIPGICKTRRNMDELNLKVVDSLCDAGVNAVGIQPSAGSYLEFKRIASFPLRNVEGFLKLGIIPVLYGDVVLDENTGFNILSGDQIVTYLAQRLAVDKVVIVTSHNGIFDRDPADKKAKKLDRINKGIIKSLEGRKTSGTDVTGGIFGKISELLDLTNHGIVSQIISGEKDNLFRALTTDECIGTIIE